MATGIVTVTVTVTASNLSSNNRFDGYYCYCCCYGLVAQLCQDNDGIVIDIQRPIILGCSFLSFVMIVSIVSMAKRTEAVTKTASPLLAQDSVN